VAPFLWPMVYNLGVCFCFRSLTVINRAHLLQTDFKLVSNLLQTLLETEQYYTWLKQTDSTKRNVLR